MTDSSSRVSSLRHAAALWVVSFDDQPVRHGGHPDLEGADHEGRRSPRHDEHVDRGLAPHPPPNPAPARRPRHDAAPRPPPRRPASPTARRARAPAGSRRRRTPAGPAGSPLAAAPCPPPVPPSTTTSVLPECQRTTPGARSNSSAGGAWAETTATSTEPVASASPGPARSTRRLPTGDGQPAGATRQVRPAEASTPSGRRAQPVATVPQPAEEQAGGEVEDGRGQRRGRRRRATRRSGPSPSPHRRPARRGGSPATTATGSGPKAGGSRRPELGSDSDGERGRSGTGPASAVLHHGRAGCRRWRRPTGGKSPSARGAGRPP